MTVPTLISNYREQTAMTKLKKFYTTMAQVQLRSIVDNGDVDTWDWVNDGDESNNEIVLNWYNKYFGQYLNDAKVIDKKVLKDDELVDDGIVVQLADGTVFSIAAFSGGYLHFRYFTNFKTLQNNTSIYGKDKFMFGFAAQNSSHPCLKRFNGYGCDQSENVLKNSGFGGCYVKNPTHGNVFCATLLQRNGWRIPKDYSFKF